MAGLRYAYDPDQPEGSRLGDVQIADAKGWFSPLEPETAYRVAITSFMLTQGVYDKAYPTAFTQGGFNLGDVRVSFMT